MKNESTALTRQRETNVMRGEEADKDFELLIFVFYVVVPPRACSRGRLKPLKAWAPTIFFILSRPVTN